MSDRLDRRRILAEFEATGEKSCPENSDTPKQMVCDKIVDVYLVLSGVPARTILFGVASCEWFDPRQR